MANQSNQKLLTQALTKSSQKDQPQELWQSLTETEQEITKGGFSFPGFPGRPVLPFYPKS